MTAKPPTIFSDHRRRALRRRMLGTPAPARFVLDEIAEDMIERLAFLRHESRRALLVGDAGGRLAKHLAAQGCEAVRADIIEHEGQPALDLGLPLPVGNFDFIAVLGLLDTVNDLPGALIHLRRALAPGGLVIASFPAAGSLPALRAAMMAAEPDRPAARIHPLIDARAGAQLLQRAGWKDPVVDLHEMRVSYRALDRLVADLRAQGFGNALARPGPPLGKAALARAQMAFAERADEDGRIIETIAILTLSGRRSLAGT